MNSPAWVRSQRTVLFADLRGSTSLYEHLGNAAAAALVTQSVQSLAQAGVGPQGQVVKTLGDGLMALFSSAQEAVGAAMRMQELLAKGLDNTFKGGQSVPRGSGVRLHIALEHGEVIELGQDCYGDAVNVAARLLDHSGDQEILVTRQVLELLDEKTRRSFRSLDAIALRGRDQPVAVYACAGRDLREGVTTWYETGEASPEPDGIRLWNQERAIVLGLQGLPALLGRSPQAQFLVSDACVSRLHAKLEWRGACIHLIDLSYNGTHVRFSDGELVSLRRSSCILHGRGQIGLGRLPELQRSATVEFELLRFAMTEPGL